MMHGEAAKQIIVVLGSGRSGTSLLMQVLVGLGMSASADMIPAKEQTPTGTFEDREIFQVQNELVSAITPQAMPMPPGWEEYPTVPAVVKRLQEIVSTRLAKAETIWGFKDPKTAMLVPLWTRVCNNLNLVPKYLLTVRNPQSVVASMKRQYGTSQKVAELFWLSKYTEALHDTGGNCFIVHYEDWFTEQAQQVATELLAFTGLATNFGSRNLGETLAPILQPRLNRAVHDEVQLQNRYVRDLYAALRSCRGENFPREEVMRVVGECRRVMDEFSGWASEARRFLVSSQNAWNAAGGKVDQQELAVLKQELNGAIVEANECLKENKDLRDELESLRIHCSGIQREYAGKKEEFAAKKKQSNKLAEQLRHENFSLRTSTSFRVGQVLVNAVAKPGKNTLLLPFSLLRIVLGGRVPK